METNVKIFNEMVLKFGQKISKGSMKYNLWMFYYSLYDENKVRLLLEFEYESLKTMGAYLLSANIIGLSETENMKYLNMRDIIKYDLTHIEEMEKPNSIYEKNGFLKLQYALNESYRKRIRSLR